jgi:hypothetical protein
MKRSWSKRANFHQPLYFLESSQRKFSSPKEIRQMKAGQNNKYDITKAPGLQVCLKSGVARSSNVVVIICPPD